MKTKSSLLALLTIASLSSFAKSEKIDGKIIDTKGNPMAYVNISLLSLPDSAFVNGTVSDENGKFNISANTSNCVLKFSSVGFQTQYVNFGKANEPVTMKESPETLNEVVVKAQLPKTKLHGTSMLTQVQGSVLEKSGTAEEMLTKIPGLRETQDGLEVLGKGSPVIYINGRKLQDKDELKRLRSEEIESVEVDMNPGSRYDATVTSVVRIRTIKRQGEGFGFSFNASDNYHLYYNHNDPNVSLNMNYRYKSLDFFGNVNYWAWHNRNKTEALQNSWFSKANEVKSIEQENRMNSEWHGYGMNYTFGTNWQISQKHSAGFRIECNKKLYGIDKDETKSKINHNNEITENTSGLNMTKERQPYSWQGNAYYNGEFGKLKIDLNTDFYTNKSEEDGSITENHPNEPTTLMNSIKTASSNMIAEKLILSYPIWKGMLNVGDEITLVNRKSTYAINNAMIQSTDSKTAETNISVFFDYSFSLPKIVDGSIGLRYEHVGLDYTDHLDASNSLNRATDDFFPNIALSRQFGKVQTSLSYSVRTRRPNYWQLSNSTYYLNSYTIQSGDPKLENQKNHELGLNVRWQFVNLSASYEHITNLLTEWSYLYNDEGTILLTNINLANPINNLSAFLNASPTIGVWTPSLTVGILNHRTTIDLADPREASGKRTISLTKPLAIAQLQNTFRLKHSWQFELGCEYNSKGNVQNFYLKSHKYNFNATIQKCWLKNDALCLRATYTKYDGHKAFMDCGYYSIDINNIRNYQRLNVSLRYNFNTTSSKYKGSGAGKESKARMGD